MKSRPVTIGVTNGTSTPAKRTLLRIALIIAMVGMVAVSTILIIHGGLALRHLRYFANVGSHSLRATSTLILFFGLLSLSSLIILTIGLVKVKKTFAVIAAVLLGICSLGLIIFSIWSFASAAKGQLSISIQNTIVNELNQTQYRVGTTNNIIVENTQKMARLEQEYHCCGLTDPVQDYQNRQSSSPPPPPSSGGSGAGRARTSSTQRNSATFASRVQLPISCCIEKYRSADDLCIDMSENNVNQSSRYNMNGCYAVVIHHKVDRIHRQGLATIVAACLAVISCIALAAVVRLLDEDYQIIPVRVAT